MQDESQKAPEKAKVVKSKMDGVQRALTVFHQVLIISISIVRIEKYIEV